MNINEAANLGSLVIQEKIDLLESILQKLNPHELERYQKTISQLKEAKGILDKEYPLTLGINVSEIISIKDKFG